MLSKVGMRKDIIVILHDNTNNCFAAWEARVFDIYGAPNTKILNGEHVKRGGRKARTKQQNATV